MVLSPVLVCGHVFARVLVPCQRLLEKYFAEQNRIIEQEAVGENGKSIQLNSFKTSPVFPPF